MENQEVYNISGDVKEVVITHKKGFDETKPIPVTVAGNIDSVSSWLVKRYSPPFKSISLIDTETAYVLVNRDKMSITLVFNESDPYFRGTVVGTLTKHPDFDKWEINTGHEWDNKGLAEFIKMNRSCFESKGDAMKISSELSSLKVKVDHEVEKANDNRGNVRQMISQKVIEMNIPKLFKLRVPIFKGQPAKLFEVEIYVNPNNYMVSLISPEANDIIATVRDSVIDEQKKEIEKICPVVIIEQ